MLTAMIASAWLTALGGAEGCWRGDIYVTSAGGSAKLDVTPITLCRETSDDGNLITTHMTYHDILADYKGVAVAAPDSSDGFRETYIMPGQATLSIYDSVDYGSDGGESWIVTAWGREYDGEEKVEVQLMIEREYEFLYVYKYVRPEGASEMSLRHRTELRLIAE